VFVPLTIPRVRAAARLILLGLALVGASRSFGAPPTTLKVMTRNMDSGTDLNLILAANDAASFAQAISATLVEVQAANIPARAARLADEISAQQPDLIGLQEVSLWRTGPLSTVPTGANTILYDQLGLLMTELARRQLSYGVIAVNSLTDVEAPVTLQNLNLRLTDRDVFLARNDVSQPVLDIYNIQMRRYQVALPISLVSPFLSGLSVFQGYIEADVNFRGQVFRFANTHLLSLIPGVSLITSGQLSEAKELLGTLNDPGMPVVLLGDFNANAAPGPDDSGTVEMVEGAGFSDVWKAVNPNDPGYTWPLYGEDQSSGKPVVPYERIDLIFSRGLTPVSAERLSIGGFGGAYASDHAGVVATLAFSNQPPAISLSRAGQADR
jgi:endonuclease/exonuclease/phosphatase family metal-dependent hydrolase